MKYQVLTRNRSMVSLPEAEHQVAILDAKEDLARTQQAVQEWRNNKVLEQGNGQDSEKDSRTTKSYTNCNLIESDSKTFNIQNNLSWKNGKEFRPLRVTEILSQPIRKCFSEFQLCGDRGLLGEAGVSVGDIFQEASLLLLKGSSNTNAAANMMRYLKPLGAETKHYTTPNQSAKNSPRDNFIWQQYQEKRANHGDGRMTLQETPEVQQDGLSSPHASQSSMAGDTRKKQRQQKNDEEDIDQVGSMPYCHGRCGIVEVLPTIMEKESPTASSSQRSFVALSGSDDCLQPKNALITVKKGANTSALAKCSLCERFGSNSQIIFSIDNVKYTFSKNGQNRLEPYTGRSSVKEKKLANTNDNKTEPHPEKSNSINSSAGPYVRYEHKGIHLPPINPLPDSSCSPHQMNLKKSKRPPRVSLPPLLPQHIPSDRKLRLSDLCREDDRKLPPIPGHIILKRKKTKFHTQRGAIPRAPTNLLTGCKLPPLKLQEVYGRGKPSRRHKYQGFQSPLNESIRNNSRCDETEMANEICDKGKLSMATEVNRIVENNEEPVRLLVKIPMMEAPVLDNPRTPRKRRTSKGSKTGNHDYKEHFY
ncbi:uncharacterized protein LOC110447182 [Mizuhopecten yessoensis]|uniref:Uncharacterized protein n=1 Tax=Mizuhopecten yessoensis TaxID=6573 RepID=A0A210QVY9_MIZYE|nr:uncharacterized protein LOC110447182 [Mizuhopecten yessoensis]OWF52929.1 hypothetical protein KP79_PYT12922 [Mizuhopecten yessoensis]